MAEQFIAVTKSSTWKNEEVLQLEQLLGVDANYHPKKPLQLVFSTLPMDWNLGTVKELIHTNLSSELQVELLNLEVRSIDEEV